MKPHHIHNMKKCTLGIIGILIVILAVAIATSPVFGQGEKVSERALLSGANLNPAADLIPIVDVSAGSIGSKAIIPNELITGWGMTTAGADMAKASNVAAQRTLLGLGTAALLDHGTAVGNLVRLDATTGYLPAVNGSLLTNISLANIAPGTGATGDIYYRDSGGVITKLPVGTNGHVLTLASGLPSWAAASGGLTNWTDGLNSSTPNATVKVATFTATNASTNVDAAIIPKGSGALLGAVPDNASTGGNKRGTYAVDWQTTRSAAAQVASGAQSTIGGGVQNTASGTMSVVAGGAANTASGYTSTAGGGNGNTASGYAATVSGGDNNTASGDYSLVPGGRYATTRGLYGMEARAAGRFSSTGDAQAGVYMLRESVTNNTPTEIALGDQTLGSTTRIVIPDDSSYGFKVHAVAKLTDETTKVWRQEGAIKRGTGAASTALVGSITEAVNEDAGATSWDLNCTADTTNGSLKVEVVGNSTGTTRFFVRIETVELTH